jgi:dipeptidyl aminopeptidase/acylaminoacyl peptidase
MSYGGYLAALVGSRLGSQVLGFVGVNGIYSPAELLTSAPPLVQAWLHREQITSQTPDAVKLVNSSTRGLLIHALNDQVAPAHQAHALAQAIARKGGKVDALWIEGEGHTIANPIHVREALESVIHFIEEAS